jgi:GNAT superfamily N-acetyltransferase
MTSSGDETELTFRRAQRGDLTDIVRMLADDPLGSKRERYENPLPASYGDAFDAIASDPNNELVVASLDGRVIGVLQLTFIPYVTYQGSWRALIEGVRVDASVRSRGVGRAMFEWAIARARERRCVMLQLTTDKTRADAKRFYEGLGFVASHEGMKLKLDA